MSRLRALGWAELYEIQWHIGPISEASIGHVGRPGTHTLGYVNMVTSAPGGMGLIVLEDWLDKRIVEPREAHTNSLNKRRFYRMLFSPGRAVANLLRAENHGIGITALLIGANNGVVKHQETPNPRTVWRLIK
jgi:hypothetical protein